jgi:hypothetical protein
VVLEKDKVMPRTSVTLLALAVVLTLVGKATAQDRNWTLMRSFGASDDFSVQRVFSGKKIKVFVYLSDITRLTNDLIQVEVLQNLADPNQPDDLPRWNSEGTIFKINCRNLQYQATDVISYDFPMGKKISERWSDDKYMQKTLSKRAWFSNDAVDFLAKIKGEKRAMLLNGDIERLCSK